MRCVTLFRRKAYFCLKMNIVTNYTTYTMRKQLLGLILGTIGTALNLQAQHGDFATAVEVCEKKEFTFQHCEGAGKNPKEADLIPCFITGTTLGNAEKNATWFTFNVKEDGLLTFVITPMQAKDDFDFVVFQLPEKGVYNAEKQVVRCMAAGSGGKRKSPCFGATGLRENETYTARDSGCNDPDDNAFLAPLVVKKGEFYALLVSNMTSGNGFTIQFNGTAGLGCE